MSNMRACDGKFADCAKYVPLPATASDATGPSQPASPPSSRPVRSKTSPGGSQHRGAPVSLAAEPAYAPVEEMRDRTDQRYDLKRRRTSEEAADGRLMELLVLASASASPDAPLSLQLERWLAVWAKPPLRDDKTADGEIRGSSHGARPGGEEPTLEKYEEQLKWEKEEGGSLSSTSRAGRFEDVCK
ncbi:hypothetical protein EMIHUDRAFT_210712 [Emiliania huxleyi CCMP1516]|uniref:Uncharacterized protein n=2 Tax=Emiliania huxleyi TaxID=2903 RepID=A0A0D3IYL0_EMIH1|nr:hypothetical protein EMIHUDRAFT_210712 [Emiliania huxleyi CCMP1516]EOD16345.1 hypothetical protein EMIHUDRAFT_210712 [Emiliania huxleyi CCMP1516]|eukprot:XP_005768774.1 hypothetical protein EMIHUDRAFT_210712 [Emiliania huxleyi CCMP1516]